MYNHHSHIKIGPPVRDPIFMCDSLTLFIFASALM